MKRSTYFFATAALFAASGPASAQSGSPFAPTSGTVSASMPAAPAPIITKLSTVLLNEPATGEGFAIVRIADDGGEAVSRSMIPIAAGARSIDLSAVSIPAAGRHTLRIVYPGGALMKEVETVYTATAVPVDAVAGR